MGGRYQHLIRAIMARPWAIDPNSPAWAAMLDVADLRASGVRLSEDEISERIAAVTNGPRQGGGRAGVVAVIPVYGLIVPRANLLMRTSGGTSAELLGRDFQAAIADGDVTGIVLDVDSPGGAVAGIDEVASIIRDARGTKPIVAIANHEAGSAAYYIAAQADELVVTPSGSVGSIGCVFLHEDDSHANELAGQQYTLITAGKFKAEASSFAPLTDEARASIQADVDTYYSMFVRAVAKGRGVSVDDVRGGYGQGRMVLAKAALDAGMVDRIDTLDNTIARVARGGVASRPVRATGATAIRIPVGAIAAAADDATDIQPELEDTTPEPDEAAAAPDASPTPETTSARVPGRRAQRELRQTALERGYAIG